MNQVIAWASFLGAWLLVAGPLYQGALELDEEDVDREGIEASAARIPRPDPPSAWWWWWWWLLPPVMYLIRRRHAVFRRAAVAQLSAAQREQLTRFTNKATGWFTVAIGAALLAAEQTWQVVDRYRWPVWLCWFLIIVMLGASVLNTALRMIHYGRTAGSGVQRADGGSVA